MRIFRIAALLSCAATALGCASWQLPRIDPSGERLFLWPNQQPPAVVGPPVVTGPPTMPPVVGPPPPGAVVAPPPIMAAPFGNVQAPPVYPDPHPPMTPLPAAGGAVPVAPAPIAPAPVAPAPVAAPIITTPAAPVAAPVPIMTMLPVGTPTVATAAGAVAPAGVDHLRVAPAGVVAPVGSELIIKAGICGGDGFLRSRERVDWSLERCGAGYFVEPAAREPVLSWTRWNAARLLDPWNASGTTAAADLCLTRGTPEATDDVQVLRGEAWTTVTSATEGTSLVTACVPGLSAWNRAVATIYWIDAQWQFPVSACVEPGRPHVLTTTVMRRTNGTPLAGWLVRYDVAGGSLGYEGGNSIEVPTDASGRASVEVSPLNPGGGTTNVIVTLSRPALALPYPSPRFDIARGTAAITWGAAGAAPALPAPPVTSPLPYTPGPSTPPVTPVPYTPPAVTPPPPLTPAPTEAQPAPPAAAPAAEPYTPPADQPPARPQLSLMLRRVGPEQVGVGDFVKFEITVTNRGGGTARGVQLLARFDSGLRHPEAKPNELAVRYPGMRDLAPGDAVTIPLTFEVVAGGTQCHTVTVSADGAEAVSERSCVTARQAALEVTVTAPRTRVVGEVAQFNIVVRNTGEVAATNVELINRYDPALEPREAPAGHERLPDGGISIRIDRLEAGERRTISTTALCRTQSTRACNRAIVTAAGGITAAAEGCVEILPVLPSGTDAAAQANLRLTVTESTNPTRVNQRQIIYVNLQNTGQDTQRQVLVRVLLPQELAVDQAQIQPQQGLAVVGQELRFTLEELPAQQQFQILLPATANRAGTVQVQAAATAAGIQTPITATSNRIEILP